MRRLKVPLLQLFKTFSSKEPRNFLLLFPRGARFLANTKPSITEAGRELSNELGALSLRLVTWIQIRLH